MTHLDISTDQYKAIFISQSSALDSWCRENGSGYISLWYTSFQTVRLSFESEIHATSFKLRWL